VSALLEARGLAIGHGARRIAGGISFTLRAGEVLALLGPNGGGKTTLLRTLLGLIRPLAGEVRLGDAPLARLPRREIARRLAYVPQAAPGGFAYTARDIVAMGRAASLPLLAAPGLRDLEIAEAALARLGIAALAGRAVTELSGGERQLVLIARALAQGTACLVLDEPTASLDFGNQARVLAELRSLAGQDGLAVLMTTHQPDHALLIADSAMLIAGGEVSGPEPPARLVTAERLRAAYGVEALVGTLATPEGERPVCLPLIARRAPPPAG